MELEDIRKNIPKEAYESLKKEGIKKLMPCQEKAVKAGLLEGKSLLVCTPTASGKTLTAELVAAKNIVEGKGKAVYIVPLKALASEKYREFKRRYGHFLRIALSIGDLDSADPYLAENDLIVCTAEKLDSLIRHNSPWIRYVATVVVDEVHLMNDPGRGPTLELLITILKKILKNVQVLCLSATIGNPSELAGWLDAEIVHDEWRPVDLHKGVYFDGTVEFE
jgi:helicase